MAGKHEVAGGALWPASSINSIVIIGKDVVFFVVLTKGIMILKELGVFYGSFYSKEQLHTKTSLVSIVFGRPANRPALCPAI